MDFGDRIKFASQDIGACTTLVPFFLLKIVCVEKYFDGKMLISLMATPCTSH